MLPEARILITKFPYYSRLAGVEKHTFQIVEKLHGRGAHFFLLASCPVLLSEFRKRGWPNQRWWLGLTPVNKSSKLLFLISSPFLIISALIALFYFKIRFKTQKLYCLTLTEKLIMTPLARLLGYKVFWLEHLSVEPVISKNIYRRGYKFWSKFVKIIVISEFVKEELNALGVKNVKVIYHGVDIEKYKRQEDMFDIMAGKRLLAADKTAFKIGCVSRLEKIRGLEYLIKAISILNSQKENIDLTIVGAGTQRDNLQWLAETLGVAGKVKLVGYKDNFLDWIYDFDVFVLPSLKESLGIILIEALACEKPVIATNVGGIPEIIEHEKHGLLVEPKNPQALADAILKIKNDSALGERLAMIGKERVAEKFSLRKMVEEYRRELIS